MLSEALRLLRVYNNLTQSDLASRLKVSKSYLSEVESGKKKASIDLLERYSSVLRVPLSSLFFFVEELDSNKATDRARGKVAMTALHLLHKIAGAYEREMLEEKKDLSN